jgi:hypothetical protein
MLLNLQFGNLYRPACFPSAEDQYLCTKQQFFTWFVFYWYGILKTKKGKVHLQDARGVKG